MILKYEKPEKTIEEVSDKLCNAEFELAPHQMFVRNFFIISNTI